MNVRIGTRGSALAMTQSQLVRDALLRNHPDLEVEFVPIKTLGDRKQGTAAAERGDKKEWVIDLELALLAGDIDLAVHSGKDVPSATEPGTELLPVLPREAPYDVFVGRTSPDGTRITWDTLPQGATVGTASLRRKASLLRLRPDLRVVAHRGNVPTRLQKLTDNPEMSGIVLAEAGLRRLQIAGLEFERMEPRDMMPAINQGTLVAQLRSDDSKVRTLLDSLVDQPTYHAWLAERGCVAVLHADCNSSVSIFATVVADQISLSLRIMTLDGSRAVEILERRAPLAEAWALGVRVGEEALASGGREILAECTAQRPRG